MLPVGPASPNVKKVKVHRNTQLRGYTLTILLLLILNFSLAPRQIDIRVLCIFSILLLAFSYRFFPLKSKLVRIFHHLKVWDISPMLLFADLLNFVLSQLFHYFLWITFLFVSHFIICVSVLNPHFQYSSSGIFYFIFCNTYYNKGKCVCSSCVWVFSSRLHGLFTLRLT